MEEISCMQYFPTLENTPLMNEIVVNYYPGNNFYMYNVFSLFLSLETL